MTVASICIAAAVLTLIGLFSALGINAAALTQRLGSNAEINIYIKSDLGDRDITDIETDLKHIDGVAKRPLLFARGQNGKGIARGLRR